MTKRINGVAVYRVIGDRIDWNDRRKLAEAFCDESRAGKRDIVLALTNRTVYDSQDSRTVNMRQNLMNWSIRFGIWDDRNTHPTLNRVERDRERAERAARLEAFRIEREAAEKAAEGARKAKRAEARVQRRQFRAMLKSSGLTAKQFEAMVNAQAVLKTLEAES